MEKENIAAVIHGINDLRVEVVEKPKELKDDEALIKALTVGICGSDIHYYADGGIGDSRVTSPVVPGHEACGQVIAIGKDVSDLKVGDKVAIEPGVPCKNCTFCRKGSYNLCKGMKQHGCPPMNGSLQRYFTHDANYCFKISDRISDGVGAIIQPLAIAINICQRAKISYDQMQNVLITGSGSIGLLSALVAKVFGARKVCITDILANRVEFARKLGIEKAVLVDENIDCREYKKEIIDYFGNQPDVVLECSGAENAINLAIFAVKDGGDIVLVGLSDSSVTLPLSRQFERSQLFGFKTHQK